MGRPKKIIAKTIKKTKKFEETVSTVSIDGNTDNGTRKYTRIQLQRNMENTYRNMYENRDNNRLDLDNSRDYYSSSMSSAHSTTSYSGNKDAMNFSVPHNSDYENSYNPNNRPLFGYHEETYLPLNPNSSRYEAGCCSGQDVPMYYSSSRQHALSDNRPLVIDTHTHVTISNYKVVSDTRMVVSDPHGSGSDSPTGSESYNSVAGTHGSESNYDVEEDLDVILTSIEQSNPQQSQNNEIQNWQTQNNGGIKTEFNSQDALQCRYSPQNQNIHASTAGRDEQYWQSFNGYGYCTGPQYQDNFQSHGDQIVSYQESGQYHGESSPTPQGLGSHMYNSLLMAYNCSNYPDISTPDYYHGRQKAVMPLAQASGTVCV